MYMTKTAAAIAAAFVALSPITVAINTAPPVSASPSTCDWSQPYDRLQKCLHQQQSTAPTPTQTHTRGFIASIPTQLWFFAAALAVWGVSDWFKKHGKNDEDESDTAAPTTYHVHINTQPPFEHQAPPVYTQPVDLSGAQTETETAGVDPAYAEEPHPQTPPAQPSAGTNPTPNGNPFESLF